MSSLIRLRSERWRLSALLLVLWGLAPLPAVGADVPTEAKAQARAKYNAGNEAYEQGNFRKALAAFNEAYQLAPLPGFLFNVAQCYRQLGSFERAASLYRQYLALSEKEPANAAMVKGLIAEMDAKRQEEALSRAGRQKSGVQAKAVGKDRPEALPAKASAGRGEPKRERSGLKEAESRALASRTSRSRAEAPKSLPPAAVPGAPAPEERESLTRKWWVWAGAGAGVLLAGGVIYAATTPHEPRPTTLGTFPAR